MLKTPSLSRAKGVTQSNPFPARMPYKVTFGDFYLMNGGTGVKVQSFRLNSLYDPDITGVGGTPTGATDLATIYESYHVDSVDVDVEFFQYGTAQVSQVGLVWHAPGEGPVSTATQIQQILLEGSNCISAVLPRGSSTTMPNVRLRKHLDLAKVAGSTKDELADGAFGSNPTDAFNLDVVSIDPLGIENQAMLAVVRLTYNGYAFRRLANAYTD